MFILSNIEKKKISIESNKNIAKYSVKIALIILWVLNNFNAFIFSNFYKGFYAFNKKNQMIFQ